MAEVFVLRLAPAGKTVSWMLADTAGVKLGPVESGPLENAAPRAGQRRLLVLVPAPDVLLTHARVPVRSGGKLAQVVPYALEEQLAEDVERLHFAIGKPASDGAIPVAVVARDTMEGWLARLTAAGLHPQALYAESAAAPFSPGAWSLLLDGERIIATSPQGQVTVFDGLSLDDVVELLEAAESADDSGDETALASTVALIVYATSAEHEQLAPHLDRLRLRLDSLEVKILPEGPLPLLAVRSAAEPGINLLQGDYAPESSMMALWRPWRVAALLLLGLLGVHIVGQGFELWSLKARDSDLDRQIAAVYRSVFPDAQRIVNPRFQMEQHLLARRGGGGTPDTFLPNLAAIGRAVAGAPKSRLDNLSYRNDVIDLRLRAPDVEALDSIRRKVSEEARLEAEIQSATPTGDMVEGRIQLRGSGG